MNLCVNGQSQVPPGFRFHPTEEELLQYYLRKQVAQEKIDLDVIPYVDLNKLEPWDIQEKCKIGSTPQNEWYFFNQKDKKYPTGTRTNRATEAGFWKATGRDKVVLNNVGRIGMRKTLVFYIGRAPCGQKSDWIMYEYRLDGDSSNANAEGNSEEPKGEDGWVVCRLFRKKNLCKPQPNPKTSSSSTDWWIDQIQNSRDDGDLEQILRCIVKPNCKQESETSTITNITDTSNKNMINAQSSIFNNAFANTPFNDLECGLGFAGIESSSQDSFTDHPKDELDRWLGLDQLVASKFSGEILKASGRPSFYDQCGEVSGSEVDEWSFV